MLAWAFWGMRNKFVMEQMEEIVEKVVAQVNNYIQQIREIRAEEETTRS